MCPFWRSLGALGVLLGSLGIPWGTLGGLLGVILRSFFNNSDVISKPFWVPKVVDYGGKF